MPNAQEINATMDLIAGYRLDDLPQCTAENRSIGGDTVNAPTARTHLPALVAGMHHHISTEIPSPPIEMQMRQGLALAEEAGEAVGALRRFLGVARRTGTLDELAEELADVVLSAYSVAHYTGIDLDTAIHRKAEKIFTRGWRQVEPVPSGAA